jgi:hypothetical protein
MQKVPRLIRSLSAVCLAASILLAPAALAARTPDSPIKKLARRLFTRALDWFSVPPGMIVR